MIFINTILKFFHINYRIIRFVEVGEDRLKEIYEKQKSTLEKVKKKQTLRRKLNIIRELGYCPDSVRTSDKKVEYKTEKDALKMAKHYSRFYGKKFSVYIFDGSYYLTTKQEQGYYKYF